MRCMRAILTGIVAVLATSVSMAADDVSLLKRAQELFQPLSKDMSTSRTQTIKDQVALGQLLFFDPRITVDGNVSCATCHQPALYGTDGRPTSIGVKQRLHPRNAPTVFNAALYSVIHWRGDRKDLE